VCTAWIFLQLGLIGYFLVFVKGKCVVKVDENAFLILSFGQGKKAFT